MRRAALFGIIFFLLAVGPGYAEDDQQPELIVERMAFKLARGVTNMATSFLELPKQTDLTVREYGPVGLVIGTMKGIGMTGYRAFIGAAETVLFLVPQPGYYDPMIDPEYVWQGWNESRRESYGRRSSETGSAAGLKEK